MTELIQPALAGFFATTSLILASLAWRTLDRSQGSGQDHTFRRLLPILMGALCLSAGSAITHWISLTGQMHLMATVCSGMISVLALARLFVQKKALQGLHSLSTDGDRFYNEGLPFGEHLLGLALPALLCLVTASLLSLSSELIVLAALSAVFGVIFSPLFAVAVGILVCASSALTDLLAWPDQLIAGLILLVAIGLQHAVATRNLFRS